VTRIPAFAPFGRRDAESSDILHLLARISRKRGFDPGGVLGDGRFAVRAGIARSPYLIPASSSLPGLPDVISIKETRNDL
jgi:hypothetical protein